MKPIAESELILNKDGSVYHLHLLPDDLADTIITVGDPDRVARVSRYFDTVDLKKSKREFVTHTGTIGGKRVTVMSSGISTDNIDIVLNELDALVNIDLKARVPKTQLRKLNIIRIGTSGAIQADIPVDSLLVSKAAFGLDTLMHYYRRENTELEQQLLDALKPALPKNGGFVPYIASADMELLAKLGYDTLQGITFTAPGFYAPQGREVRAHAAHPEFMNTLQQFNLNGQRITNLEMETAGIYGLSAVLGHRAISFNVILANRSTQTFSKQPEKIVDNYIRQLLGRIADIL
ncbi:MAG TPA: nucleoside phosphorylase [Mucilaginibacter sp.]|nr:nucleoside phosphorylase [Mucilaginibacter sp.]